MRVAELGVDAIGLNFYHRSPRHVDVAIASSISDALPAQVSRVGVFVNHPVAQVETIANRCRLTALQLHGDEPPSYLADLQRRVPSIQLIRACRIGQDRLRSVRDYLHECQTWKCQIMACLVDAHVPGLYGGSGKKLPWGRLAREYRTDEWPPLILAGGLTPQNVALAIATTKPWGVDVASGVESAPGVKDINLVRQFVENARNGDKRPVSLESEDSPPSDDS